MCLPPLASMPNTNSIGLQERRAVAFRSLSVDTPYVNLHGRGKSTPISNRVHRRAAKGITEDQARGVEPLSHEIAEDRPQQACEVDPVAPLGNGVTPRETRALQW